jgi:hypothetical protein
MTISASVEGLTPIDALMPRNYIRAVLIFEDATTQHAQTTQLLQSGLDVISKQIPWLSGRVFPRASAAGEPYFLEIRWDGHTTPTLLDKGTMDISYNTVSANGMQPESIPGTVWPVSGMIDESLHTAGAPVFAASTFRFADRGCGLCICMHHNAVDGAAFSEIIRHWGRAIAEPGLAIPSSFEGRCQRLRRRLRMTSLRRRPFRQTGCSRNIPSIQGSLPRSPRPFLRRHASSLQSRCTGSIP